MWFNAFKARYEGHLDAELTGIVDGDRATDMGLHEPTPLDSTVFQADLLTEVLAAYKALRINHQLQYANYKLRAEGGLLSASPKKQVEILSQAAFICVLTLFAIHLSITGALSVSSFGAFDAFIHNPWVHVRRSGVRFLPLPSGPWKRGSGSGTKPSVTAIIDPPSR